MPNNPPPPPPSILPPWAEEISTLYQSGASSQFLLYGNVNDRMLLPVKGGTRLGSLQEFLIEVLMSHFDVILSYDIGNGIRIEKGGDHVSEWPPYKRNNDLPREPGRAVDTLTHFFRYCANMGRMGERRLQVGCYIRAAHLAAPALQGAFHTELGALAMLVRDWAVDGLFVEHPLATFLIAENINDLNPLIVNNPRASRVRIPLPSPGELERGLKLIAPHYSVTLAGYAQRLEYPARQLAGASLGAVEALLKQREYRRERLEDGDLAVLKKELVENDANGLIEFIESHRTLEDLQGMAKVKAWLREDLKLWKQGNLEAVPKGYLLCGPVGTGKTFMVECLAGEAGVPIVRLKNFRDKWVGSSEGNLEKIFRLLHALGRCYVFIDEADQALGARSGGSGDSGVSGRLYSMMAEEMSRSENRGKIIWVLASSRPDLIEVDLKRPGRIDVRIPLFPTSDAREGFELLRALCRKRGVEIPQAAFETLKDEIPPMLTPAAAEALAVKAYRITHTSDLSGAKALKTALFGYQAPVAPEILMKQIRLAIDEATDAAFIPEYFTALAG